MPFLFGYRQERICDRPGWIVSLGRPKRFTHKFHTDGISRVLAGLALAFQPGPRLHQRERNSILNFAARGWIWRSILKSNEEGMPIRLIGVRVRNRISWKSGIRYSKSTPASSSVSRDSRSLGFGTSSAIVTVTSGCEFSPNLNKLTDAAGAALQQEQSPRFAPYNGLSR